MRIWLASFGAEPYSQIDLPKAVCIVWLQRAKPSRALEIHTIMQSELEHRS